MSEDTHEHHAPLLKIIPFTSENKHLDLEALRHRYKGRDNMLRVAVNRKRALFNLKN